MRRRLLGIHDDERIDAAARPGTRQADEPARRVLAEVDREMRDDQEVKRLRDLAGLSVVLGQGFVLIAQILLQHVFHVNREVREPFVDLRRLGPDAAIDELFVVVGQVHEGGEIFAAANRIDNGATNLAGGHRGPAAQQQRLKRIDGGRLAFVVRAIQKRGSLRKRQQRRKVEFR